MRRSWSVLPFVLVVAGSALGSMWEDPTFEKMVADAELIAVVDVVEGGPFVCTVRADEETARIIEQWPTAGWSEEEIRRLQLVRDVMRQQRSPDPAGRASVDRWIELAGRWEEDGDPWLRGSIYRELVAATPGDLRSYAVGKLRKGDGAESYQALRAINDLGGALTEEQKEEIEEGRRSDRIFLGE